MSAYLQNFMLLNPKNSVFSYFGLDKPIMLRELRPVGNPISARTQTFASEQFAPFTPHLFQSGTAALAAALITARMRRAHITNPEVLLPAYACPDLLSAARFAEVEPVLVDLEQDRPWLSAQALEQKITQNTVAIVAVNFLGIPERIKQIKALATKHDALVIEDSAQGFPISGPEEYWAGDLIVVSFGRGKPVNLLGGGAVLSSSAELGQIVKSLSRNTQAFSSRKYFIKRHLYNFLIKPHAYYILTRLPGIELGTTRFKPLQEIAACPTPIINLFQQNYALYKERSYKQVEIQRLLEDNDNILDLPSACGIDPATMPLLRYPILVSQQNHAKLYRCLRKKGLGVSTMYQSVLPEVQGIDPNTFPPASHFPNALALSQQLLTLPVHTGVYQQDIIQIQRCLEALR